MRKKEAREEIFEFKIKYKEEDTEFFSEKHFSASNASIAIEMFNFACKKDEVTAEVEKIEVWNRWANRWDLVEEEME
tara:strand:+ start:165 stop:395 length:231 start_codon:yes stop_codon:yes gene_type:complete